jgi:hypothetical protein
MGAALRHEERPRASQLAGAIPSIAPRFLEKFLTVFSPRHE